MVARDQSGCLSWLRNRGSLHDDCRGEADPAIRIWRRFSLLVAHWTKSQTASLALDCLRIIHEVTGSMGTRRPSGPTGMREYPTLPATCDFVGSSIRAARMLMSVNIAARPCMNRALASGKP
jgi:hypothetical protein